MPDMFVSNARRRRRRWPFYAAGVLLLLAALGAGAYLLFFQKEDDFVDKNAEFKEEQAKKPGPKPERFKWPIYGYTPDRTRFLDANIAPPFKKQLWRVRARGLIEFQPVLANGFLYFMDNTGTVFALNAKTGRKRWKPRKIGSLNAASPAWSKDRLFVVTLKPGSVASLNAKTGKVLWRKNLPARAESSPIVVGKRVYFGSEDGTVYALNARTGKEVWRFGASGAVKGGLAYDEGVLYFGAYGGNVYAVRAKNGSQVWSTGTSGREFNRSGNFYATPAVAYGRVYIGNTDGFVYSFVARTGGLAWRKGTGSFVYSAAAVGNAGGTGPSVYVGSYDGNFYSLDAKDGSERWRYSDGGKLSGAPTVVGKVVYFSNFGENTTTALDVRRGKRVWKHKHGAFNPVISDGLRIYLTTYSSVAAFVPRKARPKPQS